MELSHEAGWEFGGTIAGHLIGEFPHEKIEGDQIESYIAPGSDNPMRRTDRAGRVCHWILEVHLIDPCAGSVAFTRSCSTSADSADLPVVSKFGKLAAGDDLCARLPLQVAPQSRLATTYRVGAQ